MTDPVAINLFPGNPNYRERVVLDGVEFVLDLRWSLREERYYLDIRDANGALLVGAIKVVANTPLLRDVRGSLTAIPAGELVAFDRRSSVADPTLAELGDSIPLVYLPAALLAESEAA